ncbi:MAG TPA: branched-chain amino acid ABC transporter permease [Nocardioidaceae bacterium]|jgi:branched-chain amino acid transport system permease protein
MGALVDGIVIGSLYALIALGPSLVYGLMRVLDIANAAGLVLGAYLGLEVYDAVGNLWLGLLAGMAASAAFGWLLQRLLYRPILDRGPLVALIASIGVFTAMQEVFRLVFGPYSRSFKASVGIPTVSVAGTKITGVELLILVIGALVLLSTWVVLRHTRLGLSWRATSQDAETAQAMGINTGAVIASVFVLGYALAAMAGVFLGIQYDTVTPTMGAIPAYKMLAIIVLGGLGSPIGTIAAAMLLGIVETLVAARFGFVLPRDTIAFIALILVLLVRPQGLVAGRTRAA